MRAFFTYSSLTPPVFFLYEKAHHYPPRSSKSLKSFCFPFKHYISPTPTPPSAYLLSLPTSLHFHCNHSGASPSNSLIFTTANLSPFLPLWKPLSTQRQAREIKFSSCHSTMSSLPMAFPHWEHPGSSITRPSPTWEPLLTSSSATTVPHLLTNSPGETSGQNPLLGILPTCHPLLAPSSPSAPVHMSSPPRSLPWTHSIPSYHIILLYLFQSTCHLNNGGKFRQSIKDKLRVWDWIGGVWPETQNSKLSHYFYNIARDQ